MPVKTDGHNFYIKTANTMYQMKADEYGILKHIWYGTNTHMDMEYLIDYPDVGFSGNIYDAGEIRTYSTDTIPQEYPCSGNGDFRICALSAVHSDGSRSLDLRYVKHRILDGLHTIPGLPSVHSDDNDAQTLEITLCDKPSNVEVVLQYGVLPKLDIITRSTVIRNKGKDKLLITKAHSLCLDIPYGDWEWIHFYGRHAMERQVERMRLNHGIQESSSSRGTSSHQQNPTVILCSPNSDETTGRCIGAMLIYSGGFQIKIEHDQLNQTRLIMGIDENTFEWTLNPGDEFCTPQAVMSFSDNGFEQLSHNFHNVVRNNICRRKTQKRPILINNWEATYFDFDDKKLIEIAHGAAKLGVDMFVMDDGWFGKRDSDYSGLGDWYVNENKITCGLHDFVEKIKAEGLSFGIWIEPEMVSEDSDLYRTHPDWTIKVPGRNPIRSRYQLLLDMSRADVREYLYSCISSILKTADISYIKWDMNRSITNWYSSALSKETQGEMPHRYVLGLYELLDRITSDFPNVLIEGCSGGGGRFDAGILYYCPQIWCSDNTDAFDRTLIQYGTSFFYPVTTVGAHVSAVPNHQTGRITSLKTRKTAAMAGSFGYELDLNKLSSDEKEEIKEQIKTFRKHEALIHNGDYYRLSNPTDDNYSVWAFAANDKSELLVQGIIFRTQANTLRYNIKLRGIDAKKKYRLEQNDLIYSGKALLDGGILLPKSWGDYYPIELHFTEVI